MSREGRRRWAVNERFVIGKQGNPMLQRWRLVQTPAGGIYVHFIYREDLDPVPHDHPWWFASLVLRGGYNDEVHDRPGEQVPPHLRHLTSLRPSSIHYDVHGRWSFHRFPLHKAHRITFVRPGTVTLVLVGPKRRTWGFYDGPTWVDYRDALGLRPTEGVSA